MVNPYNVWKFFGRIKVFLMKFLSKFLINILFFIFLIISIVFNFLAVVVTGEIPFPGDILLGIYHPWKD
jgi:hypothetical protein